MKRKIETELTQWAKTGARPLVLFGPRRVGKTWALENLGRTSFGGDYLLADFAKDAGLAALFEQSLDPAALVTLLAAYFGRAVEPGKTLIVFDEVQLCPKALSSIKYFAEQAPQYRLAAAGSLLGVTIARDASLFPVDSAEELYLHPLDFEEFCWAMGDELLVEAIRSHYRSVFGADAQQNGDAHSAFPLHERTLALLDEYLLVGGMPRIVSEYASARQLPAARPGQEAILCDYAYDIVKYADDVDAAKIVRVWESTPAQLAKENTKFKYGLVEARKGAEKYESSVWWLKASGMVSLCTQVSEGLAPLKSFENPDLFKVYLADTGLLAARFDARPQDLLAKDPKTARFRGGLIENYVMQQLCALGHTPYYWGIQSRGEVEFVIRTDAGVVPIDAKSGKSRGGSLRRFVEKYDCPYGIVASRSNFGCSERLRTLPLYALFCMGEGGALP